VRPEKTSSAGGVRTAESHRTTNCKLTKQHVPLGVIMKKEAKLGGKMIGDSWK
jgi:hypothetical protein